MSYPALFRIAWVVLAVSLLLMTVLYAILQTYDMGWFVVVTKIVLMLLMLFVIFIVEGCEISVVGLHDKDPEQIPEGRVARALEQIQCNSERFIAGRQLFAVGAIVGVTLLAESLTSFKEPQGAGVFLRAVTSERARHGFAVLLPTFVVLWYAQLLPKFLAQEHALPVFSWPVTRLFVRIAMLLGALDLDIPSRRAKIILKTWLATLLPNDELLPSRTALYKTSATLRHGRGIKQTSIRIVIGADGHVAFTSMFWYESFGAGFTSLSGADGWGAPIRQDPDSYEVKVLERPDNSGTPTIEGPIFDTATIPEGAGRPDRPAAAPGNAVRWTVRFPSRIPPTGSVKYRSRYETYPGACNIGIGDGDFYTYMIRGATGELAVTVVPATDAPFALTKGKCEAFMSGESDLDAVEAGRVRVNAQDRGYEFKVAYPLDGTVFTFRWVVGRPADVR